MSRRNLSGLGILALVAVAGTACTDDIPTEASLDTGDAHFAHAPMGPPNAELGTTPGWFNGQTVTFFYNKDYDCVNPPHSIAQSGCVLGMDEQVRRRGGNDPVLYVLTPLFTPTRDLNLHCPVAGNYINHPQDIDVRPVQAILESVLGVSLGNGVIPLPAHSHVVDVMRGGWWEIEVNGVLTQEAWGAIGREKSLEEVRKQQAMGAVTGDIDTNLFLFFNVMRTNQKRGGPFRN